MKGTRNVSLPSLPPLERALEFKKLIKEKNLTVTEIARKINKSVPFVSNTLRLLHLPEIVRDGLMSKTITEGHARALGAVKDQKLFVKIYKRILVEKLSVRKTEKLVRKMKKINI